MSCSINDANLEVMFLLFHLEGLNSVVSFSINILVSEKDERHIARTLIQLRKAKGTVSCSRVMSESGNDLSKISV